MINLLPSDMKTSLAFAHHNTKLVKVIVGLSIGIGGILIILLGGFIYLHQEVNSAKTSVKDTETFLKQQHESETIAQVQDISSSLKLVVNVLSQEILFSKLLRQVGSVMPPNTVLQDLSLSNELGGSVSLKAGAKDYNSATQAQVNLEQRPDSVFAKVDLENISCKSGETADPNYPCEASLTAVFKEGNNFTLLNPDKFGGTQ